ncbi:MAG: SUMF1/EgtB/PvdO family nonheme iron enzyme [Calditrichaeota bacterium]|nr:SUMF1/EgtB/PvdO family nonheme iron enzyme [Candidatus Cloacimonadota bacterium]MCB1045978.1 SUMF1/EgtB/PvdO family nonheme iron enzyme [Calditrichota bacterium]MCB9472394.1 SUMF1/EgtB/PvdO family nonheme iron enzyme [Candidatus Delongbacteria bacterium]
MRLPLILACLTGTVLTSTAIEMLQVPAGSFMMGEEGLTEPMHLVSLTHDFEMSRTEVTAGDFLPVLQWAYDHGYATVSGDWVRGYGRDLMRLSVAPYTFTDIHFDAQTEQFYLSAGYGTYGGWGPVGGYNPENRPTHYLTWFGAAAACDWLSMMNDLPAFYNGNWNSDEFHNPYTALGYRLATEAEWEYAASFPDDRSYPWGDAYPTCDLANIRPGYYCVGWGVDVGSYPNGRSDIGFDDMAGNVYEWVNDWFSPNTSVQAQDPLGAPTGTLKQIRGGGWAASIEWQQMNTGYRRSLEPTATAGSPWFAGGFGLRVVRTLFPQTSDIQDIPSNFRLLDAYPNPFNPSTVIRFELDQTDMVRLTLHDSRGALVRTLAEGLHPSGQSEIRLYAEGLASGLYFVTLKAGSTDRTQSQKILLLK